LDLPVEHEAVVAEQLRDDPALELDFDGVFAKAALERGVDGGAARAGSHDATQ
jgi:hypothetical protein